jgi:hypothetical protein
MRHRAVRHLDRGNVSVDDDQVAAVDVELLGHIRDRPYCTVACGNSASDRLQGKPGRPVLIQRYVSRVPGRTNEFQELITLLVQTVGENRATPSAMVRSKVPGVLKREVEIRVEAEVDGHPIYIGIEVSASKSRKKTVEWVERMQGKHAHLSTSKLVLVSSSGFTKAGLALAA